MISKDTHLVFSIFRQASRCQQAFSKPCLVNLISKDTHLVFSIYCCSYCLWEGMPVLCFVITPGRRQSKTPILSRNVDQKSLEQCFRLPFVAPLATIGNRKHCFRQFLIRVRRLLISFRLPPTRCGYEVLSFLSDFAIITLRKRELVALLTSRSWCHVTVSVLCLLLTWVGLQCVIVAFPSHTHLFYETH